MIDRKNISMQNINRRFDVWLPFILFALIGICILLTEKHDGGAIDGSLYGSNSAHGITLAKNLINSDHPLFMFVGKELSNGKTAYDAYNRFPVFPFLIIGTFIRPFTNDLTLQIYIARQIMNIFFFLSLIIVFRFVYELTNNKYLAVSAALVTFSSYYMLSYNDMIFNDTPALFGFVTAFYGILAAQKNKLKFRHILFYALLPVSLGWQAYAVYLTWFSVDALEILFEKKKSIMTKLSNIIKGHSFSILGLAVAWGILILGLQLFNEWRIVGGSFMNLPSVNSALWRSGISAAAGHTKFLWTFNWLNYLPSQCHSITLMLIPFWPIFQIEPGLNASIVLVISAIIFYLIKYFKDKTTRNKVHLILILSGFFWTIPMRHFVALHDFQAIFYIGFAVSIYITLFSKMKLRVWKLLAVDIAVVFLISVSLSNHLKTPNSSTLTASFKNIYKHLPENSKVYFDGNRRLLKGFSEFAVDFYLSGCWYTPLNEADYAVSKDPNFSGKKLTSNQGYNLYKISNDK